MSNISKCFTPVPGDWQKGIDGNWTKSASLNPTDEWADDILKDTEELIECQNNIQFEVSTSLYEKYPGIYPNTYPDYHSSNFENGSSVSSSRSSSESESEISIDSNNVLQINTVEVNEHKLNTIESEITNLKSKVSDNEDIIEQLKEHVYLLEKELTKLNQYGRRENIEITGIPNKISQQNLEVEVLKILKKIGLQHLGHYDIAGCHRVGAKDKNGCRNTIVRFVNRKDSINCLKSKDKVYLCQSMGYNNLTIIENLCPVNKSIYENLSGLQNAGEINKVWTFNGIVNYKLSNDQNEKPIKIFHKYDIQNFYIDTAV